MTSSRWSAARVTALIVAVLVGAALGVVLGYFAYAARSGAAGASPISYWMEHPFRNGAHWWGLFGAIIGGAIFYIRDLTSSSEL